MVDASGRVAERARIAASDEGISLDELQLAARNHGMPLEALRYDVTPIGLHYLLTHYDIPDVAADSWSLDVGGLVQHGQTYDLAALRARPSETLQVTIECAGNGRARLLPRPVSQPWLNEAVGTAEWTGTPLAPLLRECGLQPGAVDIAFVGADHGIERGVEQDYARGMSVEDVLSGDLLLAYAMNGQDLLPQHGSPLRLVAPGWYGMAHVKWLTRIDVLDHAFRGFQNDTAYRIHPPVAEEDGEQAAAGEPVTRIRPRALMEPPGFPDFMSRVRVVDVGHHRLAGRAWSGSAPIDHVDVSVDGGATWSPATVEPAPGRWAWSRWTFDWFATEPGDTELCCRATDREGTSQPVDQPWNRQGMANNLVQRIAVVVRQIPARDA